MKSIANALNDRGKISWTEELPEVFGVSYTITSSLSEVKADATACSVSWKGVYTSSDDKLIETYLLKLAMVSGVRVQPYSEYRKSQAAQKVEISPETYVVLIKNDDPLAKHREFYHKNKLKSEPESPDDQEARVLMPDEQTANRLRDAILRVSKFCAAKKSDP